MRNLIIDGRLGRDAEVKTTSGGTPYVQFSLANTVYEGKNEKTEWVDVTSFDPFVINTQKKVLTKGTYAIITGKFRDEVRVKDGSVYLNMYVTANNIEVPSVGGKRNSEQGGSDYAGAMPTTSLPKQKETPVAAPTVVPSAPSIPVDENDDDDLPF